MPKSRRNVHASGIFHRRFALRPSLNRRGSPRRLARTLELLCRRGRRGTPYLLSLAAVFALASSPAHWKVAFASTLCAGAIAVALNLVFNKIMTGDALEAAYQIVMERQAKSSGVAAPSLAALYGSSPRAAEPDGHPLNRE